MLKFKTILCPTDFSAPADEALRVASDLALDNGAEVLVVHAFQPLVVPVEMVLVETSDGGSDHGAARAEAHAKLDERLRWVREIGVNARGIVESGEPVSTIVGVAKREHADLVLIATNGRRGWRRLVFGSVSEGIVRRATCPVLTLHAPYGIEAEAATRIA